MKPLQLSLRDLFWLVLVVALGLAWSRSAFVSAATYRDADRWRSWSGHFGMIITESPTQTSFSLPPGPVPTTPPPSRPMKYPELALIDFVWLVLVGGLGYAWWRNRSLLIQQLRERQRIIDGLSKSTIAYSPLAHAHEPL